MLTIEVIRQTGETVIINPLHVVSLQECRQYSPPNVSVMDWVNSTGPVGYTATHIEELTQIQMCNERGAIYTREPVAQVRRRLEQAIRELPHGYQYRDEPMYWHAGTVTHPDFWQQYINRNYPEGAGNTINPPRELTREFLDNAAMEIFREQQEVRAVRQPQSEPPVKVPPKLPLPL